MSLADSDVFTCPYCMAPNDIDIDLINDIGQTQIVDCQICCQPIEVTIRENAHTDEYELVIRCENE